MGVVRRGGGFRALRLAVAVSVSAVVAWPAPASARQTSVVVNGRAVFLQPRDAVVVRALDVGLVRPRAGFMHALGTNELLPAGMDPPKLWRNGRPTAEVTKLVDGDRVRAMNGIDFSEPITETMEPVVPPGPPEVETAVWTAGVPGVARRRVGQMSGQTVVDVLTPPQPAAPETGPVVLLSFDDGPDPRWTPRVLDILSAHGVKAVFCVVGVQINQFPDLVKRIYDEGHKLCDHTENHDMTMDTKSDDYVAAQIAAPVNEIKSITGVAPPFYRAPGGVLSPFIVAEAHRQGMRVLEWSVDSVDYRRPGAGRIEQRILSGLHNGAVVLMHDGGGDRSQTVAQLPSLIDRIRAAGYTIVAP